jgi:hypothetical protein
MANEEALYLFVKDLGRNFQFCFRLINGIPYLCRPKFFKSCLRS